MNPELLEMQDLQGEPRKLTKHLYVYPVQIKDNIPFNDSVIILNVPKNETSDVNILRMSYLKFIVLMMREFEELREYEDKLITLMKIVFRVDSAEILPKKDEVMYEDTPVRILINGEYEISEFAFDKLKTIISEQNMIGLDDEHVNAELKKKLREAEEFMAKRGNKQAPLAQRILAYQYEMKLPLDTIFNMTLYQFTRGLETINHIKNADNIQQALYSGMVTFKDEKSLPTWLSAIQKADNPLLMNADELKKNMKNTFEGK